MQKWTLIVVVLGMLLLAGSGYRTNKGAQEFIPGKGWVPTR